MSSGGQSLLHQGADIRLRRAKLFGGDGGARHNQFLERSEVARRVQCGNAGDEPTAPVHQHAASCGIYPPGLLLAGKRASALQSGAALV